MDWTATPFFTKLTQQGRLDYPLFGISLQRDASPGSLSLGEVGFSPNGLSPHLLHQGALDSTIVRNISLIEWNEVVPFEPVGIESNMSSYFEWAIPISAITVSYLAGFSLTHAHTWLPRLGVRPLRYNPHILRQIPISLWHCLTCERFFSSLFA
jgi:hypothetical protein